MPRPKSRCRLKPYFPFSPKAGTLHPKQPCWPTRDSMIVVCEDMLHEMCATRARRMPAAQTFMRRLERMNEVEAHVTRRFINIRLERLEAARTVCQATELAEEEA